MPLINSEQIYILKLKTLPKDSLINLCKQNEINSKGRIAEIINRIYSNKLQEKIIDRYIKEKYQELKFLSRDSIGITHQVIKEELDKVESHEWGMIQGELDAHIQKNYVRKFFKISELRSAVRKNLSLEVESYVLCSWYNYWTTIVIEDLIAQNKKVVPTIKKIRDIDIFWLEQPWDIKNTNLPSQWFKDGYTIDDALKNPIEAEKYLYQLQGAQRFGANNRLFLIIANTNNLEDSWKIKREFNLLKDKINNFFDETTKFDTVNFVYNDQPYLAYSKILFIIK